MFVTLLDAVLKSALRPALFAVCLAASWLTVFVSHAEAAVTGSANGPLCRLAARCAASSFRVEAAFGGDDSLNTFFYESAHLQACVRHAAEPAAQPHADIALFAHVLFEC